MIQCSRNKVNTHDDSASDSVIQRSKNEVNEQDGSSGSVIQNSQNQVDNDSANGENYHLVGGSSTDSDSERSFKVPRKKMVGKKCTNYDLASGEDQLTGSSTDTDSERSFKVPRKKKLKKKHVKDYLKVREIFGPF